MEESATASSDKDEDDEERKVEDENNDEEEEPTTEDEEKPEERDEDKEEMDEDKEEESLDEDKVQLDEEKDDKKEDEEHKETPGLSLLSCPRPSLTGMDDDDDDIEDEELEAFLQRNFSERRKSRWGLRRASSPFTAEGARRRLSTFTVSSGDDTAISIDEGEITEEEILENIRINKELIESIRYQPWRMKKKYKSLRQAKAYVKKHEGELMQSKKSGDIFAKYTIIFSRGWNKFKREVANLIVILTPWEMRIKKIESQFGSVVASYFIFLRWVFWVNFFITIFVCCFLMVPEVIRGIDDGSGMRKSVDGEEEGNALNLNAIWNFEGYLKYSPIFYGYYGCAEMTSEGYRLPLAYFLTSLCVYIFSFFVILRKMAENSRMSKLSEKDDECTFAWKLFTGWDYMIGNAETAYNKTASLVMGFKEAILEEKEKKKEDKSWKIITLRVIANFFVFILLTSSAYTIVLVVERSEEPEAKDDEGHWWRKHELQIVVGCIGTIFPNLFEMIGLMEKYHPRIQLRWQLARILVLNLLNLYTLIFSLFNRVLGMIKILDEIKRNITITSEDLATIDRMNISMSFQLPSLSSLSLIANQHLALDSVDADFQNCTFIIIQNCTIALLNQFRNGTTRTYETTDSTEGYNASFPYYNATDDISDGDEDMDSDYAAVIMRISNYTAHGVANWSFPGAVTHVHPPLYFSNGTAQFDTLYPDGIWELPINTSHLGFDDDNLTTTVRTTMYDRSKNLTTSTWLTPDEAATWILNNSETWNATEEPTTTTEQLNCTVRLCLPYSSTASPTDNLTADVTTTTRSDLTEGSTLDLNATDDITTAIATEGTDSAPATPTPTVCCGSRCSQPEYKAPPPKREDIPSTDDLKNSPGEIRANLKKNCWETMFGQELVKLTVSDIPMTIVMTLLTDFIRAVFVRYANQCWCWDLEKGFPGYGDFKIAENILHLVNNQGMIWMGMFFAPGLPAINTVKLCILLYFRSWVVLTCNIPHETVFKASGSNNFYFALLLIMLFLCTLPVGFAVVWLDPSWHCGPFSQYRRIYGVFTTYLENVFPSWLNKVMEYVTSPGVVIPLLLLLVLIIYYLLSLTGSLRESNNDLKLQLRREKSSGKPAKEGEEKSNEKGEETQNEANKWSSAKKILPVLPNKFRVSGNIPGEDDNDDDDDDKQTDSRSRRVQYSGDDEQTEEGPNGTDSPPTSETQASKNSTTQKSKRTPKPLLKSVENLRKEDTEDRRKSGRVTTGSIGSVDVPVITISQPSESKGKSKESLNSLEKMSPSPRRGKLTKKASEPVVTLTPSRNKKAKKKRGVSLEDVRSESDVGNGSDARAERSTDDTETSDAEGSVLNNHPARERRKRGEMTRYHSSRSHSSSLDTPPLIEEEEEEGRKSTLPIAATKAKLQRQQADTDSLGSNQRPKSTTDAESTSDERKEPLKENEDKKAKIQRLSTDSL